MDRRYSHFNTCSLFRPIYFSIALRALEHMFGCFSQERSPGSSVTERWPADLAVPDSSPACGGELRNLKRDSIAYSHPSPTQHPDITKILLKRT